MKFQFYFGFNILECLFITEYLSPKQDTTVHEEPEQQPNSVTTAATDNHTIPLSPSKRSLSKDSESEAVKKRGRASPKDKQSYDFSAAKSEPKVTFSEKPPKVTRNARKRLVLKDTVSEKDDENKEVENCQNSSENVKNVEVCQTRMESLRSRGKRGNVSNAVNIAEKLLAKKKV